jgi:hypothetical protein
MIILAKLSMTTRRIITLSKTFKKRDTQHYFTQFWYAESHCDKRHYAECRHAEGQHAECR